jgi:hypothetical protein
MSYYIQTNNRIGTGEDRRENLWSEILPGLWQGGTHQEDEVGRGYRRRITKDNFDSVYTMCAMANPAHMGVKELRLAIRDGDMFDFNPEVDLYPLVVSAHADWKQGKKTLIRCQAGWNRSGLLMALVLIREGFTPEEAIFKIRDKRSHNALCNTTFAKWILGTDPEFWRN